MRAILECNVRWYAVAKEDNKDLLCADSLATQHYREMHGPSFSLVGSSIQDPANGGFPGR